MKLLTLARDLRRRKARDRARLFVAEGVRAVEELLRAPIAVRGALVAPELLETSRGRALRLALDRRGIETLEVSARDFESAADTESPQGVLAIATPPDHALTALPRAGIVRLVLLDAVQDPGNVGTIVRTAAALGTHAVAALPGTVDLWNAKVVRAAMGAHFHLPSFSTTWEALAQFQAEHGLTVWGADAGGEAVESLIVPERLALIVGNEGNGLTDESRARLDRTVALAIAPEVESLNVAVATGILLYHIRPRPLA